MTFLAVAAVVILRAPSVSDRATPGWPSDPKSVHPGLPRRSSVTLPREARSWQHFAEASILSGGTLDAETACICCTPPPSLDDRRRPLGDVLLFRRAPTRTSICLRRVIYSWYIWMPRTLHWARAAPVSTERRLFSGCTTGSAPSWQHTPPGGRRRRRRWKRPRRQQPPPAPRTTRT